MGVGILSPPLPLSLSPCSLRPARQFSSQTHFSNPICTPIFSSPTLKFATSRHKTVVLGTNSGDPKEPLFMDENGVVDDMDGYLNYLSLEYDSVWDTKPSWCQPWTITLTGESVIAFSWLIFNSVVITTIASFLIASWWYIFLYSYPKV